MYVCCLASSRSFMKKIYHLATCSTNQRILKDLGKLNDFILQEIKTEPITAKQLDALQKLSGSYELLFSRRAMKYRAWGLDKKNLKEKDYRDLILSEYTFLKRPVIVVGNDIFYGSAASEMKRCKKAISDSRK